jgi:phosphoglycolate phosphatase
MIKAVFFDLDGTLLDTSQDLGNALNAVRKARGLPPLPRQATRPEVSNGSNALIALGFGRDISLEQHQAYRQELLDFYLDNIAQHTFAFDGVENLITELTKQGLVWGIVTNKPEPYTSALLKHFAFLSEPAVTISANELKAAKPDPEGLLLACKITGCKPEQAIYVGDHQRDIDAGKNAGMVTIAVGYGFTATPHCHQRWGADHSVDQVNQIWPIIQNLMA